jgi:hypothetical protein
MANGKRIALYDYVEVDGVDLSTFFHSITFTSDDNQVDVSGFNATGSDEILAGTRALSVTADVWVSDASNESKQVLYPLHRDKTIFDFVWRKNVNTGVSATNPELRGSVKLPTWTEGATRGDGETTSLTFVSDPSNPLEWHET